MRAHSIHERNIDGQRGIELSEQPLMSGRRSSDGKHVHYRDSEVDDAQYADLHHQVASGSGSNGQDANTSSLRKAGEGLKKRLSIKKKFRQIHDGEVE